MYKYPSGLISLGMDPEFFVVDEKNKIVPAWKITKGKKRNPQHLSEGICIQADNVLIEITTPPAFEKNKWENIVYYAKEFVKVYLNKLGLRMLDSHAMLLDDELVNEPLAKVFGCSKDFDVWSMRSPPAPTATMADKLRVAGGHIHIGYNVSTFDPFELIRLLDFYIMLPLLFRESKETSKLRRTLYGQAGRCRLTSYGVEYRTPTTAWLSHPSLITWVYEVIEELLKAAPLLKYNQYNSKYLIKNIDEVLIESKQNLDSRCLMPNRSDFNRSALPYNVCVNMTGAGLIQFIINEFLLDEAKIIMKKFHIPEPVKYDKRPVGIIYDDPMISNTI